MRFFQRLGVAAGARLTVTEVSGPGEGAITRPRFPQLVLAMESGGYSNARGVTAYTSHKFFNENGYSQLMVSFNQNKNIDEYDTASSASIFCASIYLQIWKERLNTISFIIDDVKDFYPRYGFLKIADARSMAGPYASGISFDDGDDGFNVHQMVLLQHVKPVALESQIIDVFPVNYITAGHLVQKIEGKTFERWAATIAGAEFYAVKPDLWVWRVDPAKDLWESGVPSDLRYDLRKRLHGAGILLSSGLSWSEIIRNAEWVDRT